MKITKKPRKMKRKFKFTCYKCGCHWTCDRNDISLTYGEFKKTGEKGCYYSSDDRGMRSSCPICNNGTYERVDAYPKVHKWVDKPVVIIHTLLALFEVFVLVVVLLFGNMAYDANYISEDAFGIVSVISLVGLACDVATHIISICNETK